MRMNCRALILLLVAVVLAAAAMTAYWPGLAGGFIFDDFPNLVHEPAWKIERMNPQQLAQAMSSGISSNLGRPLAILSFALNHAFTGADPYWLKLTSLLLHAGNGLLVFLLCRRLLRLLPSGPRPAGDLLAPLVLAGAWLLHPLQVSTVLYVVQRMEVGAATCILLALLTYVHARTRQIEGHRAWPWLAAAALATLLGLGFKESALLVPGFAFLIEAFLLRFSGSQSGHRSNGWVAFYATGFALALVTWLFMMLPPSSLVASYGARDFGPGERLLTQAPVLMMYLKQIVLPLPESMWFYYDNFPVSRGLGEPRTLLSATLLLALLGTAVACWRRWPLTSFGIVWFFMAHALTSNLIPLELAFEHRNYLALLGILVATTQPLCLLGQRLHGDARATLALIPVFTLAALCWIQASTWGDPMRLAWALENRNPDSIRASYSLGEQFHIVSRDDPTTPEWSMALRQYEYASRLPGQQALPLQGQILLLARADHDIPAPVWEQFRQTLIRKGKHAERVSSLYAVSQCRIEGRCALDDNELLTTFLHVLERYPHNATLLTMYANFAWNVLDEPMLAIRIQRDAAAHAPHNPAMRAALAKFLLASGEEALEQEGQAIATSLQPHAPTGQERPE